MKKITQTEYLAKMNKFVKMNKLAEEKIKQKEQEIRALQDKIDEIKKEKEHFDWQIRSSGLMDTFDAIVITGNGFEARPEFNHLKEVKN